MTVPNSSTALTPSDIERLARLSTEIERLSCEIERLRTLLYGDGSPGLRTTVHLLAEWVEAEKARREEERRKAWQLKVAVWGWVVAAVLTAASRFI